MDTRLFLACVLGIATSYAVVGKYVFIAVVLYTDFCLFKF